MNERSPTQISGVYDFQPYESECFEDDGYIETRVVGIFKEMAVRFFVKIF